MGTLGDDSAQVFSMLSGTLSTYLWPRASAMQSAAATSVLSSRHAWTRMWDQVLISITPRALVVHQNAVTLALLLSRTVTSGNSLVSLCPALRWRASSYIVRKAMLTLTTHMRWNLERWSSIAGTGARSGASASYQCRHATSALAMASGRSLKASVSLITVMLSQTASGIQSLTFFFALPVVRAPPPFRNVFTSASLTYMSFGKD